MKVFQIFNDFVHWESPYNSLSETVGLYAPDIHFIELPDDTKVRDGWGYLNGELIPPKAPEGWAYDEETGTFYPVDENGNLIIPSKPPTQEEIIQEAIDAYTLKLIEEGRI